MENTIINITKNAIIIKKEEEIYQNCWKELISIYHDEIFNLLTPTHLDANTKNSSNLLTRYNCLITEIDLLFNPLSAYCAGVSSQNLNYLDSYGKYICSILSCDNYIIKSNTLNDLFYDIILLIGESELLIDYTQAYRECNCIISDNIAKFFDIGYYEQNKIPDVA